MQCRNSTGYPRDKSSIGSERSEIATTTSTVPKGLCGRHTPIELIQNYISIDCSSSELVFMLF